MKCPKCGKEITDDSNFCEFCGTQVKKIKQPKRIPWIVMTILFGILLFGVGGFFYYDHTSNSRALQEAEEEAAWLYRAEKKARNDAAKQREEAQKQKEEATKAKQDAKDYMYYYNYAIELETKVQTLKNENNRLYSRINDKDREISNLRSQLPQGYTTKYDYEYAYNLCGGSYTKSTCRYLSKGSYVTIYKQSNGYGLSDIGWIPMNRLNKY